MANRARRGGAAAMYASRQTDEIEVDEDEDVTTEPDEHDEPDDDGPAVVEEAEPEPDELPDYSHEEPEPAADEPEDDTDGVKALQRQLAELQGENAELQKKADRGEGAELAAQQAIITNALAGAKGDLITAQEEYERAAAAGEWNKAANAQAAMAAAVADVREYEAAADELAGTIEAFKKRPPAKPKQAAPADPFEANIANFPEKSREWCRKNRDDLTKSVARGKLAEAGHWLAVDAGIQPETPEYFAYLDKHMGYGGTEVTKKQQSRPSTRPTGQPRVAAPGGARSAAPRGGAGEVVLSRAEVNMAKTMGISVKEYAKNKAEIIKNGKDPTRPGLRYSSQSPANSRG
jgi:hypothetical protein